MIPRMKTQAWPLAIAVVLIATNTSIVGGQSDSDEMIFMPPTVAPTTPVRKSNDTQTPPKPLNKNSLAGRANVARSNVAFPPQSARTGPQQPGRTVPPTTVPNASSVSKPSNRAAKTAASPIMQASSTISDPGVTTTALADPMQGVTPEGEDPILREQRRKRSPTSIPLMTTPANRGTAPGVRGALLGLNGESATERALKMMEANTELERENEELRQQNAALIARVKESHDQLTAGVREIQLARRELTAARGDLDRLKSELQILRDKVRVAEREYSAILQSIGPLLQQIVESDDVSALPPAPVE